MVLIIYIFINLLKLQTFLYYKSKLIILILFFIKNFKSKYYFHFKYQNELP